MKRVFLLIAIAMAVLAVKAQDPPPADYYPMVVGNELIFDLLSPTDGSVVGIDTLRIESSETIGDTTFFYIRDIVDYFDVADGADADETNIFYNGIEDPNEIYIRTFLGGMNYMDLLYFKHRYVDQEVNTNVYFSLKANFIGDFSLPGYDFSDCFYLEMLDSDSTGFVVAPDIGFVAIYQNGAMERRLKDTRLASTTYVSTSLCPGDSVLVGEMYVKTEGMYENVYEGSNGLDSTVITSVSVNLVYATQVEVNICEGESYLAEGVEQTVSGTYYDTLSSAMGCDSVIITQLEVLPPSMTELEVSICEGESYFAQGAEQTMAGTYYDTIPSMLTGCDSVIVTELMVMVAGVTEVNVSICEGESYFAEDADQMVAGTYYDTIQSAETDCKIVIITHLEVLASQMTELTVSICDGETFLFKGVEYEEPGIYYDTIPSLLTGCDSIIATELEVLRPIVNNITRVACNSYTSESGKEYTSSGIYLEKFTSSQGCDSLLSIDLTINEVDAGVTQDGASLMAVTSGATYQWINCTDMQPIAGATGQSFVATENGEYAVVLTLNDCELTSDCYTVTGVGLDPAFAKAFRIYPNPATDRFTVEFKESRWEYMRLLDLNGSTLFEMNVRGLGSLSFEEEIPAGVYIISLSSDDLRAHHRLVIQ